MKGTTSDPVRYAALEGTRADKEAQHKRLLVQFTEDAKAGKIVCLTDLLVNRETLIQGK